MEGGHKISAEIEVPLSYRRRVVVALMVGQVMGGLASGVFLSLGSLLVASIASNAWGGASMTFTTIGAALVAMPLARLVKSRGRRTSLTTGLLLGAAGAVSALFAAQLGSLPLLIFGFLLLGGSTASNLQSRFAAADVAMPLNRGRTISLVVWSTTMGAVAGPNLFAIGEKIGGLLGLEPFSGAYLICIAAQLIAVVVLQIALRPDPTTLAIHAAVSKTRSVGTLVAISQNQVITTTAIAHFSMVAIMSMTAVHMKAHGAALEVIGLTISLHIAGMYALAPVFGVLSDRLGRVRTIEFGYALIILCALLLMAFPFSSFALINALIFLGLGWSAVFVSSSALLVDISVSDRRAKAQGTSDLVMNIAGASGGALAGPVVHYLGMPVLAVGVLALVICALLVGPSSFRLR